MIKKYIKITPVEAVPWTGNNIIEVAVFMLDNGFDPETWQVININDSPLEIGDYFAKYDNEEEIYLIKKAEFEKRHVNADTIKLLLEMR